MKPMRAEKLESLSQVRFPVACTPKLDGVRGLIHPELGLVSRTLKPIPNLWVRTMLAALPKCLDGELVLPGAANFGEVSSAIMAREGEPKVEYCVFDSFEHPNWGYLDRLVAIPRPVAVLMPRIVSTETDLRELEAEYVRKGYEGIMLRDLQGPYKFGKSTLAEGYLLKFKRFSDDEAEVIGAEELHRKSGEAAGILGALICRRADGVEFAIGTGYTAEQRWELWAERHALPGRLVTYRFQRSGAKSRPRFPKFVAFRHRDDL